MSKNKTKTIYKVRIVFKSGHVDEGWYSKFNITSHSNNLSAFEALSVDPEDLVYFRMEDVSMIKRIEKKEVSA